MRHFVAKGPQPPELLELRLCRDIYHCRPSELAREDPTTILVHLTALEIESDHQGMQHPAPEKPPRRPRRPKTA